jgi:hypothetical protein
MARDWSVSSRHGNKPTTHADVLVARLAARQSGVVATEDLYACGLTRKEILVRVRRGWLHPLYRGVYAVGHRNLTLEGHFLAAVKACGPQAVLSHYAAAVLHGFLAKYDGRPIDVTAPTKRTHHRINAHRSTAIERTKLKGIPVTTRTRTLRDLARVTDLKTLTRAVRQAKLSPRELETLPRTGRLGRIIGTSTAPTRSHPEDAVLDLIVGAGLEHPEVNPPYRLADRVVYPDLYWPALRLVVEVDSAEWHTDPLAQRDDARRQADLEAAGERVIRVTTHQAATRPEQTLARLRAAGVAEAA